VGGANKRLAWQEHAGALLSCIANDLCADNESLLHAIQRYLAEHGHPAPQLCAIAIANPITGDAVTVPHPGEARDGVAQPLQRCWELHMRREQVAQAHANQVVGLRPLVLETVRERMQPLA